MRCFALGQRHAKIAATDKLAAAAGVLLTRECR
jgi:hypothetical protein